MSEPTTRLTKALADRYRIEGELGAGGMATVYLAQDLRHDRRVAIKVLRPELAAVIGAERFLSEIRTTANLQHPHILPLFDSGEADSFLFYVMPLVEGESLRDRLIREKQLPVADAVRIATEVAGALDYAHRHNVIHRDIKPENILLHDGRALVADFGIALAASKAGGTRMTETGMSLGTPHYMSPEQAMGEREITARSDVYALGAITYEMLVGEPPFTGPTAQAIIARVMTEEPRSLTFQRRTIPPHVEAAVLTALSKLPADRFATAKEFIQALANPGFASTATLARPTYTPARRWQHRVVAAVPWILIAAIGGMVAWNRFTVRAAPPPPILRVGLELPAGSLWEDQNGTGMALSPDGTLLVYNGRDSTNGHLFLRPMNRTDPIAIPGTAGAVYPSFSLDGRWLGFMIQEKIYRMPATGGAQELICAPGALSHYAWFDSRSVVVSDTSGLRLCSMDGGSTPLFRPDSNDQVIWPQVLPDRRGVLYTTRHQGTFELGLYDVAHHTGRSLGIIGSNPRYVSPGYLVYATLDGVIRTVPFDLKHLKVTGEPIVVVQGARVGSGGAAKMAVAPSGTMVMAPGQSGERVIDLVDRRGGVVRLPLPAGPYNFPRFSPDGRQVAVVLGDLESTIWLFDRGQGTLTRLTFDSGASRPTWTRDGKRIVYSRVRGLTADLRVIDASGSTAAESLLTVPGIQVFQSLFTPDGHSMVLRTTSSTGRDIWRVSLDSTATGLRPLLTSPADERGVALSPDGHWMAYVSDESGRQEVYVRQFPGMEGRRQVSLDGGLEPVWSGRGDEILYRNGAAFLSATVRTSPQFEVITRQTLFTNPDYVMNTYEPNYDLSADGQHLVMVHGIGRSGGLGITLNWFENMRAGRVGDIQGVEQK
ncbi:MAG: protein kinase [Gemmatimonadota bacterium]